MTLRATRWPWICALLLAGLAGCQRASSKEGSAVADHAPQGRRSAGLDRDALRAANHGREVLDAQGKFVFPPGVKRVWVDVGAYQLAKSAPALATVPDLGVIAVEPLKEQWQKWPDEPRLITIPFALDLHEGQAEFHVNAERDTSSLGQSLKDTWAGDVTRTVEVRKINVYRLSQLLERVPNELSIDFLKVDVQGRDLQVLESAGALLQRVQKVQSEVLLTPVYDGEGDERQGTESDFIEYMGTQGFALAGRLDVYQGKQEDLVFDNRN